MNKLLTALALVSATVAHAVPLDFDGGSGSPVTVTLDGKISYAITSASSGQNLAFVFRSVYLTNFAGGTVPADGDFYFTLNNDPFQYQIADTLSTRFGSVTALNFTSAFAVNVVPGDVVTLWSGSATTYSSIAGTVPPAEASFDTYLIAVGGIAPVAPTGIYSAASVPEPSTFAALAGLASLALVATRRTSRK